MPIISCEVIGILVILKGYLRKMTKIVKQTIKVTGALVLLITVFIGFLFSNRSMAWFAKNENVSAGGLSANVKVSPNLIIAKDVESITEGNLVFSVDFKDAAKTNMIAVTRDETMPTTFLKYLTNHYAVDFTTGNAKDGYELEFDPVPAENNQEYFIDYTVYIASAFEQLSVKSLNAMITIPSTVDESHPYFNAASIDFYVGEVSLSGYRGTTSVASNTGVDLFSNNGGIVPLNSDGHIKVIMRCYFDGALQDETTGKAYINSEKVKADRVVLGVDFVAEESNPQE